MTKKGERKKVRLGEENAKKREMQEGDIKQFRDMKAESGVVK